MSVLDRLQFYFMHFMPYPHVAPGRPQGQWVDIPNTNFDPAKGQKPLQAAISRPNGAGR